MASDVGFSHVSLQVSDIDESVAFYQRWAGLEVVDRLEDPSSGAKAARVSDPHRNDGFVLALVQHGDVHHQLAGMCHVGIGCADRAEVDRLSKEADAEGLPEGGPDRLGLSPRLLVVPR
jgi:catechol 2,3-dioxygenase-like lactoylglutathione lyase family enzyme